MCTCVRVYAQWIDCICHKFYLAYLFTGWHSCDGFSFFYLACSGPTLRAYEDEALMSESGMRPDSIPSADPTHISVQFIFIYFFYFRNFKFEYGCVWQVFFFCFLPVGVMGWMKKKLTNIKMKTGDFIFLPRCPLWVWFSGFYFFAVQLMRFFFSGEVATHLNISSSFRPRPNDPPSMSALFSFPLTIKQFETKQKFPLALPLWRHFRMQILFYF